MDDCYRDLDTGSIVAAYQVPDGCTEEVEDHYGDIVIARAGDWVIYTPYVDVVDPESFQVDYERIVK